jgi:hypothetical protein
MLEKIRGGKKIKEGEKGDGKCYFPCNFFCIRCTERVLIETTKKIIENIGTWMGNQMNIVPW